MNMKRFLLAMLVAPFISAAGASESVKLDRAPVNLGTGPRCSGALPIS